MKAKVRDTEIYFDIEGAGLVPDGARMVEKPVAFAIHGGPGMDHTGFKPLLTPLTDKMQIVYFDHRGQGRSKRGPRQTYTLENNVEDMEALRQHLGLDQIVVLGQSYGGIVALAYALKYQEHISHLILVVTASDHGFMPLAKKILAERGNKEQKEIAEKLWQGNFENEDEMKDYFEIMGPLYSQKYNRELARERRNRVIMSPDAINEAFGGFLRTFDMTEKLSQIKVPTLIIAGRHDWICPPECSEVIAGKIPHADLRIFENSAHAVAIDEHQAFIDTVRGFITYKDSSRSKLGEPLLRSDRR